MHELDPMSRAGSKKGVLRLSTNHVCKLINKVALYAPNGHLTMCCMNNTAFPALWTAVQNLTTSSARGERAPLTTITRTSRTGITAIAGIATTTPDMMMSSRKTSTASMTQTSTAVMQETMSTTTGTASTNRGTRGTWPYTQNALQVMSQALLTYTPHASGAFGSVTPGLLPWTILLTFQSQSPPRLPTMHLGPRGHGLRRLDPPHRGLGWEATTTRDPTHIKLTHRIR